MSARELSRETALRIGLAARMLPDVDPERLMHILIDALGMPLTEEKLGGVTVRTLREAGDGALGDVPMPALKRALDGLWGKGGICADEPLPTPVPYGDGDLPGSLRVAVASNSGEQLDGHFGTCARFLIYQVAQGGARLVDIRAAASGGGSDKNALRAAQIRDCSLLLAVSIGGPAAAQVVKVGVHPIKFPHGGGAAQLLGELQQVLAGSPPPWLAKAIGADPNLGARFQVESA